MRTISGVATGSLLALIRGSDSSLARRLRRRIFGTTCHIDTNVFITNPANFLTGTGCALYHATYILNTHGRLVLGSNSHLGAFCYVNAHYGVVSVGDDVAIGPGTSLIAYSNHYAKGAKVTQERITANVTIGSNVFIGANCTILPGALIGDNIVIAAASVVKGELAKEGVYAGTPARQIREAWY